MKLKFCGAAQNVTGSRHLVEVNGKKILLDCGMYQGGSKEKVNEMNSIFLFDPKEIDFVVISHAHIDHVGMVPRLIKYGFKGKIFSTEATRDIAEILLLDAAHIQLQDAIYIKKHLGKTIEPLFSETDAREAIKQFATFEYLQKFKVTDGVWATFYDAGHVLGSAITVLDIKEKDEAHRLIYTGDLGRKYLPILNDPYQVDHGNILIIECTYASHIHDSFDDVYEELTLIVNDVVRRRGKIIVPGFSFERTQELVYVLHELYTQKKIPRLPIFVDSPMSTEISAVFEQHRSYYDNETFRDFVSKKESPLYFREIKYIKSVEDSKRLNYFKDPCIIISASGMCDAGRIKHHLANNMEDPRNLILVVGFMAKGTRGRQLVEGQRKIRIFGKMYNLRAEVAVMNAFSGHADKLELLEYIRNIQGLEMIALVHGEETECAVMRDNIYNILKFKGRIDVVDLGEEFEITRKGIQSMMGQRRAEYLREMESLSARGGKDKN